MVVGTSLVLGVAVDVATANDLAKGKETKELDGVSTALDEVGLGDLAENVGNGLGVRGVLLAGLQRVLENLLVGGLELGERRRSKALLDPDVLAELKADLGPVDSTVEDACC